MDHHCVSQAGLGQPGRGELGVFSGDFDAQEIHLRPRGGRVAQEQPLARAHLDLQRRARPNSGRRPKAAAIARRSSDGRSGRSRDRFFVVRGGPWAMPRCNSQVTIERSSSSGPPTITLNTGMSTMPARKPPTSGPPGHATGTAGVQRLLARHHLCYEPDAEHHQRGHVDDRHEDHQEQQRARACPGPRNGVGPQHGGNGTAGPDNGRDAGRVDPPMGSARRSGRPPGRETSIRGDATDPRRCCRRATENHVFPTSASNCRA